MGAEEGKNQNASNSNQSKESGEKSNKKKKKEKEGSESEEDEEDEESGEESDEESGEKNDKEKSSKKSSKEKSEKEKEIKQKLETISKKTPEDNSKSEESGSNTDKSNKNKKEKVKDFSKKEEEEDEEEEEEEDDDEEEKKESSKVNNTPSSELSEPTLPRNEEDKYKIKRKDDKEQTKNEKNKKYKNVLPGEIPEERKVSQPSKLAFGYTCCQTIESAHNREITCLAYILKRNEIATGSVDETIKLWKVNYKKGEISLNKELTGHTDSVTCIRDFIKLNCFCSTSADNTVKLWDINSLKCIKTLKHHTKCVLSCCYNPLGKKEIFSGGNDLEIIVWITNKNVEDYEESKALKGHTKRISSLAFADDYNYLLSGSDDKTLRIWDLKDNENIQCIKIIKDLLSPIDFLLYLDNRLMVGCEDGVISFIKMNKMKRCRSVKFSNSAIYSFNIFHKHRYLVIGSKDGKARVWKIGTNKREVLKGHTQPVTGVCDFEDEYIVTASMDQSIKLWRKD